MTTVQLLLLPAFLQAALVFFLLSRLARGRVQAVRARKVNPAKAAVSAGL